MLARREQKQWGQDPYSWEETQKREESYMGSEILLEEWAVQTIYGDTPTLGPDTRNFYCCSVAQSCLTLFDHVACSMPGFPVLHHLLEFAQMYVHWIGDAIQPPHCLSPPSPPTLNLSQHRVFSSELALHIGWPKYWNFSFSISPSNEYSGLISFRIHWESPEQVWKLLRLTGILSKGPGGSVVKNLPAVRETWVKSLS